MTNTTKTTIVTVIGLIFCIVIYCKPVHGADVNLYAEGIYMENETWISIYADFASCVMNFGFTLRYDPLELLVIEATKNEGLWYFGDGTVNYPYEDPDISVLGQVTFVGGKLDVNDPLAGVCGTKIFLGEVKFQRIEQVIPTIVLESTQEPGFVNFVTTAGQPLDDNGGDVIYGPASLYNESGDDDQDGFTNIEEYNAQTNPGDSNSHPAQAPAIPTLSEWGMIIFVLLTAGMAIVILIRRKRYGGN